jgi:hypothetical protein
MKAIAIILILLLCSCKSRDKSKDFFDFDTVEHYSSNFDEFKIGNLYDNKKKSEMDSFREGIILGSIPLNISDTSFLEKLEKLGYERKLLNENLYEEINEIFSEKKTNENIETACIYVYRDIFIFKKDNKIIGCAKICFGCMANQIVGTKAITINFGQEGDYEKLEKLVNK